ncbi:MAG: hypothetical protein IPJ69_11180 [Deltaproteobacteria bacterium]|nr:MAG: hypothetical protein IPJ69_11180 [Deltaproteobacteria bacterium]
MKKIFFFLMLVFTAGFTQLAEARLSCMPPARSGLSTDSCTDRDYQNNLCIVEPLATQEVSGASLCVLGKFRMPAHLRNLVDMVVTYQLDGTPSVSGTLPVSFSTAEMAEARRTGEFMTNLTLPRVGHYTVMVRARMLNDMGTFVDLIFPSPSGSRVARVEPPETSVAVNNIRYRFGNSTASNCSMMTDPGCFQVMRRAGTDGMMTNRFGVTAPSATPPVTDATTNPPTRASNVSSVDICVGSAPGSVAGSFSDVRATNTITDRSQTPSRVVTVAKNCDQEGAMCRASASDFCPGGSTVAVPVGHDARQITHAISTRAGMATLQVEPFTIDLKGPDLCVRYYDVRNPERPRLLENVDGRVLLASETDSIKVDVSLKSCAASGAPESVSVAHAPKACDSANPPTATNLSACLSMSPICMQRNNEKEETGADRYVALCPANSGKQQSYQAIFVTPSFPMNTVSLKSRDDLFNINTETHYFAYGDVRPLYDTRTGHEGEFSDAQLQRAMVTKGFGSFLPASFLRGEVKDALLEVLNSPKFKEDFFPKLLEPHKPIPQEVECLRNIQEPLNCELNHLMGGDRNRVVAIKPFNNDWTSARATRTSNDPTGFQVGSIEIPTMTFFENNLLRLQVRINGMHGRAEMYTIEPQNTDRNQGDGLVDFEDDDADNDGICDSNSKILLVCDDDDHNFICDEEMGLTGSQGKGLAGNPGHCRLDTSIPRNRCPDMRNVDSTIPYPGCSDQDDDNDGFVDDQDTKGRLVDDPDFGDHKAGTPTIIPVMFTTNTVMLNLDLRIRYENGLMKFDVLPINVKGMDMVGIAPDKGTDWPINFDCSKTVSGKFIREA